MSYKGGVEIAKGKYHEWLSENGLLKLRGWARDGLIDEQIANNMGIGYSTLQAWKNAHKEIQDALKKGKEVVDIEVENALLKRALGYTYDETTYEPTTNPVTGERELGISKIVKKQVVPDTTAQIFWLKNRKPQQWRDKQEIVATEANQIAKNVEALNKSVVEGVVKNRDIKDLQ